MTLVKSLLLAVIWAVSLPRLLGFPAFITTVTFLFLLFPNGRLTSRRWRPLAWVAVVWSAMQPIQVPAWLREDVR